MNADDSSRPNARVRKEASEWVAKQDRGFTADEQDAFFEWLAKDPQHGEAYSSRQRVMNKLDAMAQWMPEHSSTPNAELLNRGPFAGRVTRWFFLGGLAACIALATYFVFSWSGLGKPETVLLAKGPVSETYERHVLQDGSVIEMNARSQVSVRYQPDRRSIELLSGEAHFTVAKDPTRPFVVRAKGAVVQAVGTMFNVSLRKDEVEVLVTEGRVLINPEVTTKRKIELEPSEPMVRELQAGHRSIVPLVSFAAPPEVESVSTELMESALAWKSPLFSFDATPLKEVITEFNRRNDVQISLANEELSQLPVTANLKLDDASSLVLMLEIAHQLQAREEQPNALTLYR